MNYFTPFFSFITVAVLLSGLFIPAFAADLTAVLIPARNETKADFIGVKTLTFRYADGSFLSQQLAGKTERISFPLNGSGNDPESPLVSLIASLNNALRESKSPVQVSAAEVTYTAVLRGEPTRSTISYKAELKLTLENFVLQRAEGGQSGDIVDLEWRSFVVNGPITLDSPDGSIDINRPIGFFQLKYPEIAVGLENSLAKEIMEDPIMDFEDFSAPMSKWQFLFDPVGSYGGGVGLQGTEGARVFSVFALGEGSLREGAQEPKEKDATTTVIGSEVQVHSQTPPPSGQIQIAGYAKPQVSEAGDYAVVTASSPEGVQTATGGFPIQVLLVLGGMMGAIAIFILFKARK